MHRAASKFEARMSKKFVLAVNRMQNDVYIDEIAAILGGQDTSNRVDAVLRLLPSTDIQDALKPLGTTTKNAFMHGGRLGAKQLRDA